MKHFAVYNQETYRNTPADNVIIDPRTEHEIYLPSFYAAVKSGDASVMCSYAVINGDFACNNSDLETTILRDQWGFPGFVMSDYGALHSTQGGGAGHRPGAAVQHLLRDAAADRGAERDDPEERAEHDGAAGAYRDVPVQPVQPAAHRVDRRPP